MRRRAMYLVLAPALVVGCATPQPKQTLADLHRIPPDLQEVTVAQGLDQAMESYRKFLQETPQTEMTPEAMRRLADLQLEKRFGIHGGDGKPREMAAPEPGQAPAALQPISGPLAAETPGAEKRESDKDFERRTTTESALPAAGGAADAPAIADGPNGDPAGPLEAIALYEKLLSEYKNYEHSDQVLYQMARAYDELGRTDEAIATMERLISANPNSPHLDEVQFRRGEYYFTRRKFRDAENAYTAIVGMGAATSYYELALYKLGWTFYKQDLYDEALQKYMTLLDYKVSIGYDFDQKHDEDDDRRVADTFRVISLGFSNLGGADAVQQYFKGFGTRQYEDRIYSNLGEHYLDKLRYDDAAKTFKAFVALYPFHRKAPAFSMRVIDTFTKGGFPKLVLESKRDFATTYGLKAEYWRHYKPEESPEVLAFLKSNLKDLANHYHAQYQGAKKDDEKAEDYREARRWYGDYLESFPTDAETPPMNYRLADLLLENKDFTDAAKQYERTAYDYPPHAQSAAAGYAAVFSYREAIKAAGEKPDEAVKRETIATSLRFADAFPQHDKAAPVLGAAADDLYEMKKYPPAVATARRVIDNYPAADPAIRRTAWLVVAHGSFELAAYPEAERGYTEVLKATPEDDTTRAGLVDNLAASIYKQGEQANAKEDYRAAADHFLRIKSAAPTSAIRPTAEYEAGAAFVRLKDWPKAAETLEAFRSAYPKHELHLEASRQIALAYHENGQLSRAAGEYDNLASESGDPAQRKEALLLAGDLHAQSKEPDRALVSYARFVKDFPHPVEPALEVRLKMADIHKAAKDDTLYRQELAAIVKVDAGAGQERTARTRTIAGRSALVLAEGTFADFVEVKLRQPFEKSLQEKKQRMDNAIDAMDGLVAYEISDVTAAATYYMAETYFEFSHALHDSERPTDLKGADMQEYEELLEEQAFPLEEKAIKVHEKNVEMMQAGAVNAWTEKSLARLADLVPGRYAKPEANSDFLESIESYVYRAPAPPPVVTPPAIPGQAPAAGQPPAAGAPSDPGATPAAAAPKDDDAPPAAEPSPAPAKPPAKAKGGGR
ncbi:MAG TPA: tetratricopeptide repeat protein [Dongiaceae bacterium]|nr:tetratricopeptide repeat protein [Dongiaceae bacterium]